MPLDKYTHEFFKSVRASLSSIIGRLDQLVGLASRPRDNDKQTVSQEDAAATIRYTAIGKSLLQQQASSSYEQQNTRNNKWYKTVSGWKTLFELIAIPFAIWYAIITFLQWKDLRNNFELDERAWVMIDPKLFSLTFQPNGVIFLAGYENFGKTVAYQVTAFSAVINQLDLIPSQDVVIDDGNIGVAPTGVGYTQVGPVASISDDYIKSGKKIYFYGTIWYSDIFGKRHSTQFCYYPLYLPDGKLSYPPCSKHNQTDGAPK